MRIVLPARRVATTSSASASVLIARAVTTAALLSLGSVAQGSIIHEYETGSGSNTSTVQVDFQNGNGYLLTHHWNDSGIDGWDAIVAIDIAIESMSLQYEVYSWGAYLTGITMASDHDFGNGDRWPAVENYWHYWNRDSGAWEQSWVGASDDALFNGSWDAWVFGSPAAPQAVPAPGVLALAVAGAMAAGRRRPYTTRLAGSFSST
ncbi:MAG: hypothetical protein EXS00_09215 [Phycisphaerales bacterium]|nr:hypothetical protein [Phycisphaerales bacterium]